MGVQFTSAFLLLPFLCISFISLYLIILSFSCLSANLCISFYPSISYFLRYLYISWVLVFRASQCFMFSKISCITIYQDLMSFSKSCISFNLVFSAPLLSQYHVPHVYKYTMYTIYLCVTWIYISHDLMIPLSHVFSISYIAVSHTSHYLTVSYVYHVSQYRMYLSILSILVSYVHI